MEEQHEDQFELLFDINGIQALKSVIDYAIERWPGAPQRPKDEQEFLWHMRDMLAKCQMEYSFHNLKMDR